MDIEHRNIDEGEDFISNPILMQEERYIDNLYKSGDEDMAQ